MTMISISASGGVRNRFNVVMIFEKLVVFVEVVTQKCYVKKVFLEFQWKKIGALRILRNL